MDTNPSPWNALWLPAIKLLIDCTKITSWISDSNSAWSMFEVSTDFHFHKTITNTGNTETHYKIIIDGHIQVSWETWRHFSALRQIYYFTCTCSYHAWWNQLYPSSASIILAFRLGSVVNLLLQVCLNNYSIELQQCLHCCACTCACVIALSPLQKLIINYYDADTIVQHELYCCCHSLTLSLSPSLFFLITTSTLIIWGFVHQRKCQNTYIYIVWHTNNAS